MVEGVMRSQDLGHPNMMPMGPLHQHRSIFLCISSQDFPLTFLFLSFLESTADAWNADGHNADADADATGNATPNARNANGSDADANANANAARHATWDAAWDADGPYANANANADATGNAARDAIEMLGTVFLCHATTHTELAV